MSKRWIGIVMLLLCAMIWGAAFVAQTVGMEYVEPFTFQACRCFLGSLILLPVIAVQDRRGNPNKPVSGQARKKLWISGVLCGILLFSACSLQQYGLLYTSTAKSGFITSLYIILVPIISLFFGKKVLPWIWISVVLAVAGLYLLCGGGVSIGPGELLTLGCAIVFTFHILLIDKVSPSVDGVRLSCIQFFVCGAISLVCMLVLESPDPHSILQCWLPIAYAGFLSCGAGYTLQILAQARTEPTIASLLMSLESVFAALFGWILLQQRLSALEILGCTLVFGGVVLAQLPSKRSNTVS